MSNTTASTTADQGWPETEKLVAAVNPVALLVSALAAIVVGVFASLSIIGTIDENTARRAAEGFPLVIAAFGAASVAIGVGLRLFEVGHDLDVASTRRELAQSRQSRPARTAPQGASSRDAAKHKLRVEEHERLELSVSGRLADELRSSAKLRSVDAGLEFAGSLLLVAGAVSAAFIWNVS